MKPHERTGRQRHRIHTRLFRKPLLVLQEEWEGFIPEYCGGIVDGNFQRYWLDAKPEDVLEVSNG